MGALRLVEVRECGCGLHARAIQVSSRYPLSEINMTIIEYDFITLHTREKLSFHVKKTYPM